VCLNHVAIALRFKQLMRQVVIYVHKFVNSIISIIFPLPNLIFSTKESLVLKFQFHLPQLCVQVGRLDDVTVTSSCYSTNHRWLASWIFNSSMYNYSGTALWSQEGSYELLILVLQARQILSYQGVVRSIIWYCFVLYKYRLIIGWHKYRLFGRYLMQILCKNLSKQHFITLLFYVFVKKNETLEVALNC
jgi:hypothetical protein